MAHYQEYPNDKTAQSRCVCIPSYETTLENVTLYHVRIIIGEYYWVVKRRYSEFHELNEKLITSHGIERFLLPPKKLFGNQSEQFIQKRRMELEQYLKTLFTLDGPPPLLRKFLHFHKYEIHGIIQTMAEELFYKGDALLQSNEMYPVTPLQLHSLTMRLKMPIPTCDTGDKKKDIGHILDFLSQVHSLHICGCNKPIGSSNIVSNNLIFDLSFLKSLLSLKIDGCNPKMIQGLSNVRKTVQKLQVQDSMKDLKNLLLCDILHWDPECPPPVSVWFKTLHADFSYNQLANVDNSIWLLRNVETLDLSHNQISRIENLDHLSNLARLQLSFNCFSVLPPLHVHLGNIVSLNFAGNSIESLQGFSKLYSLMYLDLHSNQIQRISEIGNLADLPCLETLNLTSNPVTMVVDYRTRVLEQFNNRASELCLDNEQPTQKELDTVAILQAIRRAKEGSVNQVLARRSLNVGDGDNHHPPSVANQTHSSDKKLKSGKKSSLASHGIAEFRQEIEQIRAQGGTGWLRLWNQHQTEHKNKPGINPESTISSDINVQSEIIPEIQNDSVHRHHKESVQQIPLTLREFIFPEDLPDVSSKALCSILESQLVHPSIKTENESDKPVATLPTDLEPRALPALFWTIVIHRRNGMDEIKFPACVTLADDFITMFVFRDVIFEHGLKPQLTLLAQFPHGSVVNVEVGRHHHFIRIEIQNESGICVYVLKFASKNLCASFVNNLQIANQQRNAALNFVYLCLDSLDATVDDADLLKGTINYSWVAVDSPIETDEDCLECIAIAQCYVCLVYESLGNFVGSSDGSTTRKVLVVKKWNILTDVTDLSFENPVKLDRDHATTNDHAPSTEVTENFKQVLRQSGFRIVLWLADATTLSVRFPSAESRDEFLEAFTQERNTSLSGSES